MLHPQLAAPDLATLPHYTIEATLAPPTLAGRMRLRVPNNGDLPLPDLLLRLYGNASSIYTGSRMEVTGVRVDGQLAQTRVEGDGSALRVLLPSPLPTGGAVTLTLDFETTVATGAFQGYGIQQVAQGIGVFGSPFPLLALRDGATWRFAPVPRVGDAVSSPAALWDLFLSVPDTLTLVSTGETVGREGNRLHIVTGPARDVALVTLPAGARPIEQEVEGVTLRYWPAAYVEAAAARFSAERAATIAANALAAFVAEFGPPPYAQLDLIEAQVPIGGYEYPGLVLFDGEERAQADEAATDFLIPHEIAHQWFYALVGNDVTQEPWLDEGLATYAQLRYLAHVRGEAAAQAQRARWEAEYRVVLARRPVGVNLPLYGYSDWLTYRGPTYYASAILFDDLRLRLGDAPFGEAMRRLTTRFAFREATTTDLVALFDEVAAENGTGLEDVWEQWVVRSE